MDANQQFEQIKTLLRAGDHEAALAALDTLIKSRPNAAALHWHRSLCLEALDRLEEALVSVQRTLALKPDYAPAWLKQAELASYLDEEYPDYAHDIQQALRLDPSSAKAHTADALLSYQQDNTDAAFAKLAKAIALAPDDAELYLMRAGWHETAALQPDSAADALPQFNGLQYSRRRLELADADYSAAIARQPQLNRAVLKRAQLRHKLGRFDEALRDYDAVLQQVPAADPRRDFIVDLRKHSENQGAGEREATARLLEQTLADLPAHERQQLGADLAASAVRSAAASMRSGQSLATAMEQFVSDDPNELVAVDIAYKVHAHGNEPAPEFVPAEYREFSKDQQRFAEQASRQMQKLGFVVLGDFNPVHLNHMLNRPTLVRVYRSSDGHSCAASYKLKPSWPGWLAFVLLKLTGKWHEPAVVDFESEFSDGHFLVTNNSGQLSPFGYGSRIDTLALPLSTSVPALLAQHLTRIAAYQKAHPAAVPTQVTDSRSVFALQTRLNQGKRAYRRGIGYITDAELQQMLGARYQELQEKVRQKLQLLIATDDSDTESARS